jgi:MFS family permease
MIDHAGSSAERTNLAPAMASVSGHSNNPPKRRVWPIFLYFASATIMLELCGTNGTLLDLTTAYLLQVRLHAPAMQVSVYRVVSGLPLYGAIVFGLTRDLWNPLGLRDRGYLRVFSIVATGLLVWLAFSKLSYASILVGVMLLGCCSMLMAAAQQGLMALVAQEQFMSGRLAAVFSFCAFLPFIGGALFAGSVADRWQAREIFLFVATLTVLIAAFSFLKPKEVFENTYDPKIAARSTLGTDLRRLVRHRAFYPAILMMFLWQFAPALQTVLQYYFVDKLHGAISSYGYWTATYYAAFLPGFLIYGYLCQRVRFGRLGAWSLLLSAPLCLGLPAMDSAAAAIWFAVPLGLASGAAYATLYDVAMRACPPGLHGTLMMAVTGANNFGWRAGDTFGVWLYQAGGTHGFLWCCLATGGTSCLSALALSFVPVHLRATADGESLVIR